MWVSEHVDLLGDPLLGPEAQQRFLPSRYTLQGDAIDAKGMTCRSLACPRCHLPIPRAMLEMEPLFISILGATASGKSYFLTAMTWQLRQILTLHFKLAFTDADLESNRALNECEESLFLNHDEAELAPLGSLISNTQLVGKLYDTVAFGQQTVTYPRPFLFTMQPQEGHPAADHAGLSRMLCLYDNAGEHFLPGQDRGLEPGDASSGPFASAPLLIRSHAGSAVPRRLPWGRFAGSDAAQRPRDPPGNDPQRGGGADPTALGIVARQQIRSTPDHCPFQVRRVGPPAG